MNTTHNHFYKLNTYEKADKLLNHGKAADKLGQLLHGQHLFMHVKNEHKKHNVHCILM